MARGRKVSKPGVVEVAVEEAAAAAAAAAAMLAVALVAATVPGPEMVERRGPGRPCTDRENMFTGQSEIYTYMSPTKCSAMHFPFQEENSVAHHKVKCHRKPFAGIYMKQGEKRTTGNSKRSTTKSEELKVKDSRRGPLAPFPNPKSGATEPSKTPTLSCDFPSTAIAKQALKKSVKGKQAARKKAQGRMQQNHKLKHFYPVQKCSRKSQVKLQSEERKRIDELIKSGKKERGEDGDGKPSPKFNFKVKGEFELHARTEVDLSLEYVVSDPGSATNMVCDIGKVTFTSQSLFSTSVE
ncbi:LOW QUALITY PROTEIN: N-lysine methyltransferase KMT5A-like [Sturnira hondurensis]|uniref:LOW QUALITY PROTEIN: N-lysine methyltransferase KMT5A-like n=1 Tax=Sturnira hondurensis TaxID=192404 RepID=UPI0018794937|nr:LOW QUALITY PROTEIN: N-lysine methyltransferase KMT5A-like [Sturnira hondurensis]